MATVRRFATDAAGARALESIRGVCDAAFGAEYSDDDWHNALGGWHAVACDGDLMVAHASVVPRTLVVGEQPFAAGYVESVATLPARHGEGLGSLVMDAIGAIVRDEFELGALSTGRHAFYRRLGWERWQGPTFVRDGDAVWRTEEDDDGVMVLRFGASASIDLAAPITCEARPGDDW